jgi:hypothetical protein
MGQQQLQPGRPPQNATLVMLGLPLLTLQHQPSAVLHATAPSTPAALQHHLMQQHHLNHQSNRCESGQKQEEKPRTQAL